MSDVIQRVYNAEPTPRRFHASNAFFRGIMGPIGSGKSVACVCEILKRSVEQSPTAGGERKTLWAVIRNTYPELRSTTIRTWKQWVPEEICPIRGDYPINAKLVRRLGDGTTLHMEVYFLALDRPADIKKMLSLELTGAWINEARELPRVVIEAVSGRVGRYPAKSDAPLTWCGIIADTNPPDDDHWWFKWAELGEWKENVENYGKLDAARVRAQLIEMRRNDDGVWRPMYTETEIDEVCTYMKDAEVRQDDFSYAFFRQPGALIKSEQGYLPNPRAENVQHQPRGYHYWLGQLAGKSPEYIKVFLMGEYGSLRDGRPVYEGIWNEERHLSRTPLAVYSGIPLRLGWDFGLNPACVIGQLTPKGQLRIVREFTAEHRPFREFARDTVLPALANDYAGMTMISRHDPAEGTSQVDGTSCADVLAELGIDSRPARTNDFQPRWQAVSSFALRTTVDGRPGLAVDPGCRTLVKGFNGAYVLERVQVIGEERYKDVPSKNLYSHPQDGLQYLALEAGEGLMPEAPRRRALPQRAPGGGVF